MPTKAKKSVKADEIKKPVKRGFVLPVLDIKGKEIDTISLPKELFGVKPNKQLIAQAIRVYLQNQREGSASTKTRGEVEGSTRKIYRQKGTGKARHGAIRAPIFVGGGIVFGPRPHSYTLNFPKAMKTAALRSSLSQKFHEEALRVIDGLVKLPMKTKSFVQVLHILSSEKSVLLVTGTETSKIYPAVRNISFLSVIPRNLLTTYELMTHRTILFAKDALEELIAANGTAQISK